MFKWIRKKLTNNYTEIPLLAITFDYQRYIKFGNEGSCLIMGHPAFKDDEFIQASIESLITYIREKYDMEKIL